MRDESKQHLLRLSRATSSATTDLELSKQSAAAELQYPPTEGESSKALKAALEILGNIQINNG